MLFLCLLISLILSLQWFYLHIVLALNSIFKVRFYVNDTLIIIWCSCSCSSPSTCSRWKWICGWKSGFHHSRRLVEVFVLYVKNKFTCYICYVHMPVYEVVRFCSFCTLGLTSLICTLHRHGLWYWKCHCSQGCGFSDGSSCYPTWDCCFFYFCCTYTNHQQYWRFWCLWYSCQGLPRCMIPLTSFHS